MIQLSKVSDLNVTILNGAFFENTGKGRLCLSRVQVLGTVMKGA